MQAHEPTPIHITSWQDAERAACAWMRRSGYPDAALTPAGPDGGVDVRASAAVAQVKFEGGQAGIEKVQRFVGAAGRNRANLDLLFFSASGFTKTAAAYAESEEVALFVMGPYGAMRPASSGANRILEVANEEDRATEPTARAQASRGHQPECERPARSDDEDDHREEVNRWLLEQQRKKSYPWLYQGRREGTSPQGAGRSTAISEVPVNPTPLEFEIIDEPHATSRLEVSHSEYVEAEVVPEGEMAWGLRGPLLSIWAVVEDPSD